MKNMVRLNKVKHPARSFINITGAVLSAAALVVLVVRASWEGTVWHIVSFAIYGTSLVALWTMSAVYHSLIVSKKATDILRQFDHAMIYLLIAGTYTPICLVVLRGGWGWTLFGINWGLAVVGIFLKLFFRYPTRRLIVALFLIFLIMGWLIVVAWFPLIRALPQRGTFWLVLGGVFYTSGAAILNIKRLDVIPGFGAHEIWHLFVLAGSFCHFWMMIQYVLYLR